MPPSPPAAGSTSSPSSANHTGVQCEPSASSPDNQASTTTNRVAVLGATGSIGAATIEVLDHLDRTDPSQRWEMTFASCHRNVAKLSELCDQSATRRTNRLSPIAAVISDDDCDASFTSDHVRTYGRGGEALSRIAADDAVDIVVAAIVGSAGLPSTLAAARAGKRIALANKEALVVAGPLIRSEIQSSGGELLPIDSEHSAIFQALGGMGETTQQAARRAEHLILTASGGPFRTWTTQQMSAADPQQAMKHPTWDMGPKITIDSATMMNKALEIIEARWLFDVPADQIEVMIHPQSIIHSMVRMPDGSVIAQMSPPDMKMPIQLALTYPRRLPGIAATMDVNQNYDLTLEAVDQDRFPAIELGFEVAAAGGTAGAVVNAANERAVELFIDRQIKLTDIVPVIRRVLGHHDFESHPNLERLMTLDRWARDQTSIATR